MFLQNLWNMKYVLSTFFWQLFVEMHVMKYGFEMNTNASKYWLFSPEPKMTWNIKNGFMVSRSKNVICTVFSCPEAGPIVLVALPVPLHLKLSLCSAKSWSNADFAQLNYGVMQTLPHKITEQCRLCPVKSWSLHTLPRKITEPSYFDPQNY